MDIKSYMVLAVAALTAACNEVPQNVDVPADENAAAQVELNDDGSVKNAAAYEITDKNGVLTSTDMAAPAAVLVNDNTK